MIDPFLILLLFFAVLAGVDLAIRFIGGITAKFTPGNWTPYEGFTIFLLLTYLRRWKRERDREQRDYR